MTSLEAIKEVFKRPPDALSIGPAGSLADESQVLGRMVDAARPTFVVEHPFEKVIEAKVIHARAAVVDIRRVDVHEIEFASDIHDVGAANVTRSGAGLDRAIGLRHEVANVRREAAVPGRLVAKRTLDLGRSDIQIRAMKQIVRPLRHGGLEYGIPRQRPLKPVGYLRDDLTSPIKPAVLFVGEIDAGKSLRDESVMTCTIDVGEDPVDRLRSQCRRIVLQQCDGHLAVGGEDVGIRDPFAQVLEHVSHAARPAKRIQHGFEVQRRKNASNPRANPPFASLVTGRRKKGEIVAGSKNGRDTGLVSQIHLAKCSTTADRPAAPSQ